MLLVPTASAPVQVPVVSCGFACVLNRFDTLVAAHRAHDAGMVSDPRDTPWGTRDVEMITPEKV